MFQSISNVAEAKKIVKIPRMRGEGRYGPRKNFTSIPNQLIDSEKLSCQEKIFLIVLFRFAFGTSEAWPGTRLITKLTGISRRNVIRIRRSLEGKKLIHSEKEKGKTIHYFLPTI